MTSGFLRFHITFFYPQIGRLVIDPDERGSPGPSLAQMEGGEEDEEEDVEEAAEDDIDFDADEQRPEEDDDECLDLGDGEDDTGDGEEGWMGEVEEEDEPEWVGVYAGEDGWTREGEEVRAYRAPGSSFVCACIFQSASA